jgi:CheY-like chemotaxis protein
MTRVLVAEDDATMRHLMVTILSRQGISCAVVEDGRGAVQAWERERFEFIVMDVQMPTMDGLEATRLIREKEAAQGGHTVIIATTAFAMDSDRERCFEAGMDDYLSKPLDVEELLAIIEKHRKRQAGELP